MKRALLALMAMFVTVGVMAQGQIFYQTKVATANIDAKIVGPAGTALGAGILVGELGYNTTSSTAPMIWTGITAPVGATGYIVGGTKNVPGLADGVDAWFQIRAFDAGKTWETKTVWMGQSEVFGPIKLTALPAPPANMTGLKGFAVEPVPEPSVLALGLLGLGAFMLRRRS